MRTLTKQHVNERATSAKNILSNPDFEYLLNEVKEDVFHQFCTTNVMDTEVREEIFKVKYGLDLFRKKLESYVSAQKLLVEDDK